MTRIPREPDGAVTTAILLGPDGNYYIERWDGEPARNRWQLVYPDGSRQRTKTKRDAERIARLHASDRVAWTRETQGSAAAAALLAGYPEYGVQPHDRVSHPDHGVGTVQPIGYRGYRAIGKRGRTYPTPRMVIVLFDGMKMGAIGLQVRAYELTLMSRPLPHDLRLQEIAAKVRKEAGQ